MARDRYSNVTRLPIRNRLADDSFIQSSKLQECIDACVECRRICMQTLRRSLQHGGDPAMNASIRLLDAMDACQIAADELLRHMGDHRHSYQQACAQCAETCESCAKDLESGDFDAAVQACRRVTDLCRQITMSHAA